jgi:uncharacterized protein (DUF302 family)
VDAGYALWGTIGDHAGILLRGRASEDAAPHQLLMSAPCYFAVLFSLAGGIMGTPLSVPSADGVISKPSPYSVDETIRRLDEVVRGKGLAVFARIDHRAAAREAGLDMQDEQVLIFGNPSAGTPLMMAQPLVGLDLPLRVLVWRGPDGRVVASYQDAAFIARRYRLPEGSEKNISTVAALVEAALR